jgi:Raf kinase inhibitor-like YbhB/YbcL family protein
VNKEGRTVAASLARVEFFHWVLIDLPADTAPIARGEFSDGVTARGKPGPAAPRGARQGVNDYTGWFAGDREMAGNYFGYDGPCPPWNDEIAFHRYVFTLYALDVARLDVSGVFNGAQARSALAAHALAQASVTGRYTLNPSARP